MSKPECMATHAHNIHHSKSKMADGKRSRFNPVYFNGRRILDFATLRPKNKSKVRKQRTGCSVRPLDSSKAQYMPEDGAANTVTDDDEAEVDVGDGLHEQPLSTACEAVSEDQGTLMVEHSIIQEYVLLLCRYDGVTMIDHRRFCLPQFNSGQHKLMVSIYEMNVCLGTNATTGQDFNEGHKCNDYFNTNVLLWSQV